VIRVNLLPQKRGPRGAAAPPSQRWLLVVLGVLVLQVVGMFLFHQKKLEELEAQRQRNTALETKIADIRKLVANHEEVKKGLAVLRARDEAIQRLQTARTGPTAVLLELGQLLTPGKGPTADPDRIRQASQENPNLVYLPSWDTRRLWLTSYLENDRTVRIEGLSRDGSDVAQFAQRLKLSAYFYDVTLLPGKKEPEKDGQLEVVSFALQLKVRY